jgi:NitT/TauT family transport system substrate-binding protein
MHRVHIRFLRFSAFYSPLLLTMSAGHLTAEGIEATYDVVGPGRTIADGVRDGSVHVAQSATAVSFEPWTRGEVLPFRHFALLNRRDGFFLARRGPRRPFEWNHLEDSEVVADHFFQPLAMLRCALAERGVETARVKLLDVGQPADIEQAFRHGAGDFVHLQGPAPQQLEVEGLAHVVASVGEAAWPIAFSSLCASAEWLDTEVARAFVRAFEAAKHQARTEHPRRVAELVAGFLPGMHLDAIEVAVAAYQRMGTWDGTSTIEPALYAQTVRLFRKFGDLEGEPPYPEVVSPLPG